MRMFKKTGSHCKMLGLRKKVLEKSFYPQNFFMTFHKQVYVPSGSIIVITAVRTRGATYAEMNVDYYCCIHMYQNNVLQ